MLNNIYHNFLNELGVNELKRPVFYSLPFCLRFELGLGEPLLSIEPYIVNKEYISSAVDRAAIIFKSCFQPEDEILIVLESENSDNAITKLFDGHPFETVVLCDTGDEGDCYSYTRCLTLTTASKIPEQKIFYEIAMADFNGNVCSIPAVFFIHLSSRTLLFMYDDRGLDLAAADRDTLKPVYLELNDMLLDYDRAKMDEDFI